MDKVNCVYRLGLFFSEYVGMDNIKFHSPDYLYEKMEVLFNIPEMILTPYEHEWGCHEFIIKYEGTWGPITDTCITRFILFIFHARAPTSAENYINNFEKFICPIQDIVLTNNYFPMHFKTLNSINEIIELLERSSAHKNIIRSLSIKKLLSK